MSQLYLILHKVRGQPALDCAEKVRCMVCEGRGSPCDDFNKGGRLNCDGGYWWIIPTSGHRAYPFKVYAMEEANKATLDPIPDSWPDHYSANDRIVAEIKKKSGVASVDDLMF